MSADDKTMSETMSEHDERRELVPLIFAGMVAAVCLFYLWFDLSDDSPGHADGTITSAVVSRAGAIVAPSRPSGHFRAAPLASAFEQMTVGRVIH
jgi:hypothetical protein